MIVYSDAQHIAVWARENFADSLQAGIVTGTASGKLLPKALLTRAESAVLIRRLLQASGLI